jgi:hypothetical protein
MSGMSLARGDNYHNYPYPISIIAVTKLTTYGHAEKEDAYRRPPN